MVSTTATLCSIPLQSVLCVVVVSMYSPTFASESSMQLSLSDSPELQLQCPPGFLYNTNTNNCECYPNSNIVCNDQKASMVFGYCMTYEEGEGSFLGLCTSFLAHGRNVSNRVYLDLPGNLTDLNDYMCGPMNRKGVVCSECIDGFAPAFTSLDYQCSNCTDVWYGVPLFIIMEFVPITIFYFIIIAFRFSITSAPMTSYVLFSQQATLLFASFASLTAVIEHEYGSGVIYFFKLVTSFYGIWSLDFFGLVVPSFCISPHLKPIHIFSFNYISAFYPLILIGFTWVCIELHSRNFKPLTWIWHYMNKCYCCKRRQADTKRTIVDVFATFFLLSYTKLLTTSIYFLILQRVERNGSTYRVVSGIDPATDYFSKEHAPFAVLAILILIGPVLIPVIILGCYPVRAFRSLLEKCKISGHSWVALNLFVEKFYSCYKDGLDGGKDLRSFACLHFLLRLSIFIGIFIETLVAFWFFHFLVFGGASLLIAIVQPYKRTYMTTIDSLILAAMSLFGTLYLLYLNLRTDQEEHSNFFFIALCLDFTLPLFGIVIAIIFKIFKNKISTSWIQVTNYCRCLSTYTSAKGDDEATTTTTTEAELPDRILHPYHYVREL